jgi:fructokinase
LNLAAICFGTLALRSPVSRSSILDVVRETTGLRVLDVNIRPPFLPAIETLRDCFRAAEWVKLGTDDLAKAGDLLRESERDHCPAVRILTKGDAGCEITGDEVFRLPADPSKVVDTVGAGDAFTAAMVCLHLEGRPLAECARFATHYAARVCEHQGATPRIDRAPVERAAFGAP